MKRTLMAAIAAVLLAQPGPVLAQATFPTQAPGVRAGGQVFMKCDAGANGPTNCRPVTAADPLPTTGAGGGPATIADGGDTAEGRTTDTANCATDATPSTQIGSLKCSITKLVLVINGLTAMQAQLHSDLIAATPAGTAVIGKTGIDQTTQGVTNGVVLKGSTSGFVRQQAIAAANAGFGLPGGYQNLGTATLIDGTSLNVMVYSPTAATMSLYFSPDNGTTTILVDQRAISAGVPYLASYPILDQYYTVGFTNGSTAQSTNTYIRTSVSVGR